MAAQKRLNKGRRDFLKLLGMVGGFCLLSDVHPVLASAKSIYPDKKLQWIVYTKPGGGFDLIARNIAPFLGRYLKESSKGAKGGEIVIKNVTAAGGLQAFNNIYNAKPDGYTFGDFNTGYYCESMFTKSDIDYRKYTYLLRTGISSRIVITNTNGFKSWAEVMEAGKEREVKWAVGNYGAGSHVSAILVKEVLKVPARMINFPGTAENANAVLRGDVQMGLATEESAKPLIQAGELRALAVFAHTSPYPGVPSLAQLGHPKLADATLLHRMIIAPPHLPRHIAHIMSSAFNKTLNDPAFRGQAKLMDFDPAPLFDEKAEQLIKEIFKYYDDNASILKKYLA
jgi:tripartite-type tricarboxylate transporter receptor subunit TctC